jgi:anti-sigma regulatory factor (Ser/Thr protein kinase)
LTALETAPLGSFAHEAFLYESPAQHLDRCAAFIEEGLDLDEPVLVAVPSYRLDVLAPRFAAAGDRVRFENMEEMGRNPAWIIPAWADFAGPHVADERPARGIGEPIWPARSADQLVECARHESLLNLAFAQATGFTLLCPYDVEGLPDDVLDGALRNHPTIHQHDRTEASDRYHGDVPAALSAPLPPPPPDVRFRPFELTTLTELRERVRELGAEAGLATDRIEDLAVVTTEAATNSVRHAGGHGTVGLWRDGGRVVCEIRDSGTITDPLAGRRRPDLERHGGRGLWLIQQLADLVQHRVTPDAQVLRIHVGT